MVQNQGRRSHAFLKTNQGGSFQTMREIDELSVGTESEAMIMGMMMMMMMMMMMRMRRKAAVIMTTVEMSDGAPKCLAATSQLLRHG